MVQQQVLDKLRSDKLKVFVVWLPALGPDSLAKAKNATKLISDKRTVHFWDGETDLGRAFKKPLKINRKFAWDVYLVFDGDVEWKKDVPKPNYWQHQLQIKNAPKLNGADLLKEVKKAIMRLP